MRSFATFSAAILIALPLAAAETKPSAQQQTASAQPAATAAATDTAQLSSSAGTPDSPLVAAAKRTKRTGKSKVVITNETLSKAGSNARVTTTASQKQLQVPVVDPDHDWSRMEQKKIADEAKAKADAAAAASKKAAADEARRKRTAAMAGAYEEGYSEADPAAVEHELSTQTSTQPQSTTTQGQPAKPPQNP